MSRVATLMTLTMSKVPTFPNKYHSYQLLKARFKDQTRKAYRSAVNKFLQWCATERRNVKTMPQLDRALLDYFEWTYRNNGSRQLAINTHAGVIYYRRDVKGHLPFASEALRGWQAAKPSVQHPPFTWPVACVVAVWMTGRGWLREAIGTLLAFDCLLRVSELCALRATDVIDAKASAVDQSWKFSLALRLRQTKTGENQSVPIANAGVGKLVRILLRFTSGSDRLFPRSTATYRKRLKTACAALGLDKTLVPHSLRHGGATHLYMSGVEVSTVKVRGRWVSLQTCERYVQAGQALIGSTNIPAAVADAGRHFAEDCYLAIRTALSQTHSRVGRKG